MRLLLCASLLFLSVGSSAQPPANLLGTWKVVAFGSEELFRDIGNDTITYNKAAGIDSAALQAMSQDLPATAPQGVFIFDRKGTFQETEGTTETAQGTFRVDTKAGLLVCTGKRNGIPINERFQYRINEPVLFLPKTDDEDGFTLRLQRLR